MEQNNNSAIDVIRKLRNKKDDIAKRWKSTHADIQLIKKTLEVSGFKFSSDAENLFQKLTILVNSFIEANSGFDNNRMKDISIQLASIKKYVNGMKDEKEKVFFMNQFDKLIVLAAESLGTTNDEIAKSAANKITGGIVSSIDGALGNSNVEQAKQTPGVLSKLPKEESAETTTSRPFPTSPNITASSNSQAESQRDDIDARNEQRDKAQERFNEKMIILLEQIRDNTSGSSGDSKKPKTNENNYNRSRNSSNRRGKSGLEDFAESTNNKTMSLVLKAMGALGGLASGIFSVSGAIIKAIPPNVAAAGVGAAAGAAWFGTRSGEILGKDEKDVTTAEKVGVSGAGAAMGAFAAGTPAGRILAATLGVADLAMKTIYGEKAKDLNITKEFTDSIAGGIGKTVGDISKYGVGEGVKDILYGNFKEDREKESKKRADEGTKQAVENVQKKNMNKVLNTYNEYNKLTEEQKAIITGRFPSNATTKSNPSPEAIEAVGGRASYDANIAGTNTPKIGPLITSERVYPTATIKDKQLEPQLVENKTDIDQFTQYYAKTLGINTNNTSFNEVGIASAHGESKGDPGIVSGLTHGMIKAYSMLPENQKTPSGEIKDIKAFKVIAQNNGIKLDPGGPSYGLYQFSTWSGFKPNENYPLGMFLKHLRNNPEAKEISQILENEGGGFKNASSLDKDKNAQFRAAWKKAATDPKFGKFQVDFYTHGDKKIGFSSPYQEVLQQFKKAGIDPTDSLVLKNTAWAGGVLGTANSQSIINNLKQKYNTQNLSSVMSNDQFVKEYYTGASAISLSKSNLQSNTSKRYLEDAEKQSELYRQEISFRTNGADLNRKAIVAENESKKPQQMQQPQQPVVIAQQTTNQNSGTVAMGVGPRTGSSHRALNNSSRNSRT